MKLTIWQWLGLILFTLNFLVLMFASRYGARCNELIEFIETSPKKKAKVQAWFEKRGGYNPEAHAGAIIATLISLFLFILIPLLFLR